VASLTLFRVSWTPDRGNGKNSVPSSPCPQPQSIALVAAGCNVARNDCVRQKQTKGRSRRNILHRCGSGTWGDTGGWSVSVVLPNGHLIECDCLAAASGTEASAPVVRKNLVQSAKCTGFGANGQDFLNLCSAAEVSVRS
jgi:hypothetical protein